MKLLILIVFTFVFFGCVPKNFEEKCRPGLSLEGKYKIDNPKEFYTTISSNLSNVPIFNYVKISKSRKKYYFELLNNDTKIESFLIKLHKNKKGVYSDPKNQYFFTLILFSQLGGRTRFFGINSENNLITEHNVSFAVFFLFIPMAGNGYYCYSNEWQRVENVLLPNEGAARDASHP